MPLFSEHISNMYYSGSPSYSAPYSSYSSVLPLGSSYSASYLNPGGTYSTHSSLGYSRPSAVSSRWVTSSGRNYAPMLSTISERGTASPSRIGSPRRIPFTNRMYTTPSYTPRPININTADIDVSKDKYRNKIESTPPPPPPPSEPEKDSSPFMPRIDGKPETGIDSSPGVQRSTIRRGRTVVRLHTVKRKDRDSPRKSQEELAQQASANDDDKRTEQDQTMVKDETNEPVRWREKLSEDLTYKDKREKKTIGAKLVEKFIVKDKDSDSESSIKESRRKPKAVQSLPVLPLELPSTSSQSRSPDRRCSMEMLVEQANVLDSLIRGENLSTATLDLSKVGVEEKNESSSQRQPSIKRRKSNDQDNPLQTTKSDYSLHESLNSFKDSKHLNKRRSLKKSFSGGSICRLGSITEFPKEPIVLELPSIAEKLIPTKQDDAKSTAKAKPKLKAKITSSVEISPPMSPLKFKVDVTVEEKPRTPKKEIIYSSIVEDFPLQVESNPKQEKIQWKYTTQESKLLEESKPESPEPDNGNFWDKIGKRETVYLMKRKQYINDSKERNRRALFWFPDDEEESEVNDKEVTGENVITRDDSLQKESISSSSQSLESLQNNQEFHDASDKLISEKDNFQLKAANLEISQDNKLTPSKSDVGLPLKTNVPKKVPETNPISDLNKISSDKEKTSKVEIKNKAGKTLANDQKIQKEQEDVQQRTSEKRSEVNESKLNVNSTVSDTKPLDIKICDPKETNEKNNVMEKISNPLKEVKTIDNIVVNEISKMEHKQDKNKDSSLDSNKLVDKDENKMNEQVKEVEEEKEVKEVKEVKENSKKNEKPKVLKKGLSSESNVEDAKNVINVCPVHGISDQSIKSELDKDIKVAEIKKGDNNDEKNSTPPKKTLISKTDEIKNICPVHGIKEEKINPDISKDKKVLDNKKKSDKVEKKTIQSEKSNKDKPKNGTLSKTEESNKTIDPVVKTESSEQVKSTIPQTKEDNTSSGIPSKNVTDALQTESKPLAINDKKPVDSTSGDSAKKNTPEIPIVIEAENIPNKEDVTTEPVQENDEGEKEKPVCHMLVVEKLEAQPPPTTLDVVKPPRRPVKEEAAARPLIATPRPLQKKTPQVIHSSSSESSSEESSSDEDADADESNASDDSTEFFECENNPDGRTSTGSNDSGFESTAPTSPAGFVQMKKGGENAGSSATPAPSDAADILEQELEQSTAYSLFKKTGRFTPPARSIPRFRKYNIEDFHFIKVLGKGSFGKVLLTELRDTEYYYAVKCLKKDVVLEDDDVECTLIERKVLALGTNHPYLCHLFATFQTDSHLFFVMEYLNGGDLMFHIQQSGRFPEARARFYAAEIVSGLKFLHKRGIVYRDLKLDNILLDFDGHVRIADFGMCKLQIYLEKTADTFCGTPDYMAPEIIKGLKYNQTVDWWSFGVLLYEMLIGQSPFSGCDEDELFWSICNEMPSYPRFLSQEALTILTRLLDKDARTRLGGTECMYGDVREQDFFHAIHWDRLERRELEAPFRPRVRHPLDTQYFDRAFTGERPRLTAVEPNVLRSMDQEPFRGFSYTNPNATDR